MGIMRSLVLGKLILLPIALFIIWQAVVFVLPRPVPPTASEQAAIHAAAEKAVAALEPVVPRKARFGIAHLNNDPGAVATTALKAAVAARDGWAVEETSPIRKFLADVARTVMDATTLDEILHAGRRVELDILVAGRLDEVGTGGTTSRAVVDLAVYDLKKGERLATLPARAEAAAEASAGLGTALLHWLGWLAAVAALPLVTFPLTRLAHGRKSNLASAVLLASYLAADAALAFFILGLLPAGLWSALGCLALLLACAALNFLICEKIAGM